MRLTEQQIMETLEKYRAEITAAGYIVYAICLKGSQNYQLDDDTSDVDANAILLPNIKQLCRREPVHHKFIFENGEVIAHDIYSFLEILQKGNPQFVECVQTPYLLCDDLAEFHRLFGKVKLNPTALKGMALEKLKALTHRYPSRAAIVDQFGYDPKQLHHIIRLRHLLEYYLTTGKAIQIYEGTEREQMLACKREGIGSLDVAVARATSEIDLIRTRVASTTFEQIDFAPIEELATDIVLRTIVALYNKRPTIKSQVESKENLEINF